MNEECTKCGYKSAKNKDQFGKTLCEFCFYFSPEDKEQFEIYINEKIDWRQIQTYRKQGKLGGIRQKRAMKKKSRRGTYNEQGGIRV